MQTDIRCADSAIELAKFEDNYFDMVLTSPPYDNLRSYKGYTFDFETIAKELYRVLKSNGTMVWVVGDATIKGSETGTSFKQALYFKNIGFKLYDTEIYLKKNPIPQNHKRYEQCFEYMFVLTKGTPKTFNAIRVPCKTAGKAENWGNRNVVMDNNQCRRHRGEDIRITKDTKQHTNVFEYSIGQSKTNHPAVFPLRLALDNIYTWSNEGDLVLDPFCGSGTTGVACKKLDRNFIGIDTSKEYVELAKQRIEQSEQ